MKWIIVFIWIIIIAFYDAFILKTEETWKLYIHDLLIFIFGIITVCVIVMTIKIN